MADFRLDANEYYNNQQPGLNTSYNTADLGNFATRSIGGGGGNMPAGAIIGGVASGISALGGLFKKNKKSSSGYTLPEAFQYDMIDNFEERMAQMQADLQKLDTMEQYFTQKMDMYQAAIDGQILDADVTKGLQEMNVSLIQSLGVSAQELADNGFLSSADMADLQALKELEAADYEDPRLKRELDEQKAQLLADMRRNGASPQEISQALNQFDVQAREAKFARSQELKQSQAGLISNRMGLRQGTIGQNINIANNSIAQTSGLLQSNLATIGFGSEMANNRLAGQSSLLQMGQGLRQEQQLAYTNLGEFKFSGRGKDYARRKSYDGMTQEEHRDFYTRMANAGVRNTRMIPSSAFE